MTAGKARKSYTLDEAAKMLDVSRTTILILLAAIRPGIQPGRVKRIKTPDLERLYAMVRKDRTSGRTA